MISFESSETYKNATLADMFPSMSGRRPLRLLKDKSLRYHHLKQNHQADKYYHIIVRIKLSPNNVRIAKFKGEFLNLSIPTRM